MITQTKEQTFILRGGKPLRGSVQISGSKNAALGAMAACLLVSGDCFLENMPRIGDIEQMAEVLRSLGAKVNWADEHVLRINAANVERHDPKAEFVKTLRGSFLTMGALLGRLGEAACSPPGGDIIGARPIDVHIDGFRALGAEVSQDGAIVRARASRLRGSTFVQDYPSVLGTQNVMMAAARAEGTTHIVNAAPEPEVQALAAMLCKMGARVEGAGTGTITVEGTKELRPVTQAIIPDRLEAGTFAIAAAITGGEVTIHGANAEHLTSFLYKLRQTGTRVEEEGGPITVSGSGELQAVTVQAVPYPGFATDLQAPMAVLLTQADGKSTVHERVFENRFLYIDGLRAMGADIMTETNAVAIISGPTPLHGTRVEAPDIRAGAAFILAGLAASGQTDISDIYHVERGYERIDEKLRSLGADIEKV